MATNVEIISKELIKPSSPTPRHLRNFKLSFLDQIAPPIYVPIILFYQSESASYIKNSRSLKSQSLKQSLSQNLTRFYPLAGRIKDDVSVDCNDAGVEYVEALVQAQISQVIENPSMEELTKFLPINPSEHTSNVVLLAIQINFFACGGLAVAVCVSHRIADGFSLVSFINSWASQSIGKTEIPNPDFGSASKLFPPIENLSGFKPTTGITQEHVVTKRFVFDKMKLATLLKQATCSGQEMNTLPTRVEAVSTFIWKQLINESKAKNNIGGNKEKLYYVGVHAVNLRPRISPPLGDQAFGNIWRFATAVLSMGGNVDGSDHMIGYNEQVGQLRDAIRKIDGEYVKGLQDGQGYMNYLKMLAEEHSKRDEIEFCGFSSWCRFPVYEVDYGWGRPVWVCTTTMPFDNVVILMSTRYGDGIEAWVSVVEADLSVLEAEYNLL